MAYRRSKGKARKPKKIEPAVMQLEFQVPAGSSYIDLALAASIVNRRGYKQEDTTWAVSSFELFIVNPAATGTVAIGKLPETWVMENAYTKGKALWERMNDQVLDTEPSIDGAYEDFKIGMDAAHCVATIQDTLNPAGTILTPFQGAYTVADFNTTTAPIADWDMSVIEIPNDPAGGTTTGYKLHALGPDGVSKGLIAGYALSRARPAQIDPNVPRVEGWMNELFDDGEQLEEIRDNLMDQNDRAPYPVGAETSVNEYYPGGANEFVQPQVHSFCNFTSTTVSQKNTIMGGIFKLGLMKIINDTESVVNMLVHLVPGHHRGYMVERD